MCNEGDLGYFFLLKRDPTISLELCRHIGRVIPALAVSQETEILRDQEKIARQTDTNQ